MLLCAPQGGTARTVLIINASPCMENGPETLSSLRFGSRALGVKCKVAVNSRLSPDQLQAQLATARSQVRPPYAWNE
jgi:kinesin family protein 5